MTDYTIEIPEFGILDTYNNIDASFTYSFQDLGELNSRVREFSKTIKLPATNNNTNFFGHIFEASLSSAFNTNKSVRCNVRVGSTNIFKGYLKLNKIIRDLETPEYEVSIISITKNFLDLIGDKKLNTIDLSEFNHIRDKQTIYNSWETSIMRNDTPETFELGKGYVYPKIVYGKTNELEDVWYVFDSFPSTYVKTIIDKLFEDYGFTYTSAFLETEYFKRLILPFIKDKLSNNDDEMNSRGVKAGVIATEDTSSYNALGTNASQTHDFKGSSPYSPNTWVLHNSIAYGGLGFTDESTEDFNDESDQMDNGGLITIDKTGYYTFVFNSDMIFEYSVDETVADSLQFIGGVNYEIKTELILIKNNVQIIADSTTTSFSPTLAYSSGTNPQPLYYESPWVDDSNGVVVDVIADNHYMEAGDKAMVRFTLNLIPDDLVYHWNVKDNGTLLDDGQDITIQPIIKRTFDGVYNYFESKVSNGLLMGGEEINMNQVLPDMKIKDFLGGIIKMFNLTFNLDPNNENNIIIEPTDTYLKSGSKIKDWSKKLDRESYELIPTSNKTSQTMRFEYLKDEDYFNKEYTTTTDEVYGNLEITTENDFNVKTDKTKLPFASTPISNYFNNIGISPMFIDLDNEGRMSTRAVKPRILFYGGMLTSEPWELKETINDANPIINNLYPYCGHLDNPITPKYDLNFGSTEKVYFPTSLFTPNTLYNQFHRNMVESIISKDGRRLVGNFLLTPIDVESLLPNDVIHIDGVNYRVLEVKDYNPVAYDKLTKVELLKIIDFEKYDRNSKPIPTFTDSCPVDVVADNNGVLFSPSGETVTEVCCSTYGGNWENGRCYVKNISGEGVSDGEIPISEGVSIKLETDFNSGNTGNVIIKGTNNTIGSGVGSGMILGNNNGLSQGKGGLIVGDSNSSNISNPSLIVGDNSQIFPSEDDKTTIILGDGITIEDGVAQGGGESTIALTSTPLIIVSMVEAGRDEILNPFSTTKLVNIIDGGRNCVRGLGGDDMTMLVDAGRDKIN